MLFLLSTALFIVLLDQISKIYIRNLLLPGDSLPVIEGFLYITHVQNKGAAFGLLAGRQLVFILVTILSIVLIAVYYFRTRESHPLFNLALGLAVGGAVGNLVDRLRFGGVTDFVDVRVWPVFNIADTAIVVGVVLLIVASLATMFRH
jgi:signal peptidase II